MTEPRDMQREQQTGRVDPGLDVSPKVIQDLDVTDDADVVRGGRCGAAADAFVPGITWITV